MMRGDKMKWVIGQLTEYLHYVGYDPIKSDIEDALQEEFKDEPEILDRIIGVFAKVLDEVIEKY